MSRARNNARFLLPPRKDLTPPSLSDPSQGPNSGYIYAPENHGGKEKKHKCVYNGNSTKRTRLHRKENKHFITTLNQSTSLTYDLHTDTAYNTRLEEQRNMHWIGIRLWHLSLARMHAWRHGLVSWSSHSALTDWERAIVAHVKYCTLCWGVAQKMADHRSCIRGRGGFVYSGEGKFNF